MISRIEALRYRSLRYVSQKVGRFQVLVGPNASGKSTFLDVVAFLGDLLQAGLGAAVQGEPKLGVAARAPDPSHLVWMRRKDTFELAIELSIPEDRRANLPNGSYAAARYEVAVGTSEQLGLLSETLWLKPESSPIQGRRQQELFPSPPAAPESIVLAPGRQAPSGWRRVVSRGDDPWNVTFRSETVTC
jgi:hypothetical protein